LHIISLKQEMAKELFCVHQGSNPHPYKYKAKAKAQPNHVL